MLAKINSIDESESRVNVTLLDIDELGSILLVEDLNLNIVYGDESIIDLLKTSTHAVIFTEGFSNEDHSTIISVLNLTEDELNEEKEKMIKAACDPQKKEQN